ncbi:MAG: transporter [Candidatus Omnitrophica bacterium]|nr:transporter [Candidatus Omnitrophota bacterium]
MKENHIVTVFIFSFIIFLISDSAYAFRPLSTEDTGTPEKGKLEIESGFTYARESNTSNNFNFSLVSVYGLLENMALCVELPFDVVNPDDGETERGFSDMALAVKTLLLPESEKLPSFLLKTIVKLPTGDEDKGLGSGKTDTTLMMVASKTVDCATIHGNIGYTFVGGGSNDDNIVYGVALEYGITPKLALVGEAFMETENDFDKEAHSINPLVGLRYRLTEKVTLDTAFSMGICHGQKTDYSIISGMAVSF